MKANWAEITMLSFCSPHRWLGVGPEAEEDQNGQVHACVKHDQDREELSLRTQAAPAKAIRCHGMDRRLRVELRFWAWLPLQLTVDPQGLIFLTLKSRCVQNMHYRWVSKFLAALEWDKHLSWRTERHPGNFICVRPLSGPSPTPADYPLPQIWVKAVPLWTKAAKLFLFEITLSLFEGARDPDASVQLKNVFSGSFRSTPEAWVVEASLSWVHSLPRLPLLHVWTHWAQLGQCLT